MHTYFSQLLQKMADQAHKDYNKQNPEHSKSDSHAQSTKSKTFANAITDPTNKNSEEATNVSSSTTSPKSRVLPTNTADALIDLKRTILGQEKLRKDITAKENEASLYRTKYRDVLSNIEKMRAEEVELDNLSKNLKTREEKHKRDAEQKEKRIYGLFVVIVLLVAVLLRIDSLVTLLHGIY
jgi:hypothetical protein